MEKGRFEFCRMIICPPFMFEWRDGGGSGPACALIGALDGGVLSLHVKFKKPQCRPVEFKKCSCRPVEFKKCSCRPVEFKKCSCPMSLRPKIPHVALSILGV